MDYTELLRKNDDPVNTYAPLDFDDELQTARFEAFVVDLEKALSVTLGNETGTLIQDASFHSQVLLPPKDEHRPAIRFSAFGDMVTIYEEPFVDDHWRVVIKTLLQTNGYIYVPPEVLAKPYTGSNRGVDGFRDWSARYFSWV